MKEWILYPLPYLRQKETGSGKVWEVGFASHHTRLEIERIENLNPPLLARKDFEDLRYFKKELDVLRSIMDERQMHHHLVPLLTNLQREAIDSLFFPLADRDVSVYFRRPRHPPVPESIEEKNALIIKKFPWREP